MKRQSIAVLIWAVAMAAPANASWVVRETKSPIDDSPYVLATALSERPHVGRYRSRGTHLLLELDCHEGSTRVGVYFAGEFMTDGTWGRVTTRFDDQKAQTTEWSRSTNHKWLMITGERARAFMRSVMKAKKLVVRATPYNESPITTTFAVEGAEPHVGRIAQVCKWREKEARQRKAEAQEKCEKEALPGPGALHFALGMATGGLYFLAAVPVVAARKDWCEKQYR